MTADLRDPSPRDATTTTTTPTTGTAGPGGADPLHNLYRMSLTAGLGSGDYVAINNTSIIALLLGLLSVTAMLYPIMLVAALAAVVVGAFALVQIRSSNGTQSGRIFAALGILLGLALGGVTVGKMVVERMDKKREEQAIGEVIQRLNDFIVAREYGQAYQTLFSARFKQDFTEQQFAQVWEQLVPYAGRVKSIGWNNRAEIDVVRATNSKRAVANGDITFEKTPTRQPIQFTKAQGGEWEIDVIMQLFEKKQEQRGPGGPMPDPTAPLGPQLPQPGPGQSN